WAMALTNSYNYEYDEAIENAEECLRIALSPMDRGSASNIRAIAVALKGSPEEGLRVMEESRPRLVANEFVIALLTTDPGFGLAMVLRGELTSGVRHIEETMRSCAAYGSHVVLGQCHIYLGEIYLQMALGKEKPPPGVLLKNLGFILRTAPFAARKARRHLTDALRIFRELDAPSAAAWALMDLGLLEIARKKGGEARTHLEEARDLARSVDAAGLSGRIDEALASL
ncbi:MAG: hypothetical protein ACE5Q3_14245, partial [Alphaproteobacteria bacterium]